MLLLEENAFLLSMMLAGLLVFTTVMIHYEILRAVDSFLPRVHFLHSRIKILVVIFGVFLAHTIEVWVFAFAYYYSQHYFDIGAYHGETSGHITDAVYFSVVVYTSLGFGDIQPKGELRLIAGVEALVGLIMIGWSTAYTFMMMEKFWGDHPHRRRKN